MWPATLIYALAKDEHREALDRNRHRNRDAHADAVRQRHSGRSSGIDV